MPAANQFDSSAAPSNSGFQARFPARFLTAWIPALLVMLAPICCLSAQGEQDPRVAAVTAKATTTLHGFAKKAAQAKALTRSRQAYQILVDHYDADHQEARAALGQEKRGAEWQQVQDPKTLAPNKASKRQLARQEKSWRAVAKQLAKLHRVLGLKLMAEDKPVLGRQQLARALAFDANDLESHKALGHQDIDGFFGTEEQLAFVRNMKAMLAKAKQCAALAFDSQLVAADQMPAALKQSGLPFHGARSEHFEHWVIGSEDQAQQSVVWAERALVMVRHLLGEQPLAEQALDIQSRAYLALVRTVSQRDQLLQRAPVTLGEYDLVKAKLFSGVSFQDQGKWAEWAICNPSDDNDRVVAHVMMRCAAQRLNHSLSEGLVHALTWMMCGTVKTRYMQLAHTVSQKRDEWPLDAAVWRQRLEQEIDSASDWPLVQVPRERMDNYRDPVRAKSWSFCVWLLARHPENWLDLCAELNKKNATQTDVDDLFAENLALDVAECEAEWRAWAQKNSAIGKASGWH